MRGRSSSKQGTISRVGVTMEKKHKVDKVKDEPHLSGAYIRSLVKHLTSIKSKDSSTYNGDEKSSETLNTNGECLLDHNSMQQESSPPPPPPHKKQVRRRQHTSKPYQERLLNMAEARREIVTALKYHRASMKQQESSNNLDVQSSQSSRANPRMEHYSSLSNSCPSFVPYCYPISAISPPPLPPLYHENINFALPNQPLGLNLNFHDFKNLDANLYQNPLSNYSTSSSSSSSSTSSSAAISEMAASIPEEVVANSTTSSSGTIINDLHHAMDDEEMEEIRSLGEQHQIEWNDRVNFVMSARWFNFLKTIDTQNDYLDTSNPFDHHFRDDYLQDQDPALTRMDIGEIEGMDGEWLA